MVANATPDESLLLARLADGGEEPFVALRAQLERARVAARTESPAGIVVELGVPDDAPRVAPADFEVNDVGFAIAGGGGSGFATLRVDEGVVVELEVAPDDGDWPVGARIADVAWTRFVEGDDATEARFERVPERDLQQLRWTLAEQAASSATPAKAADPDADDPGLVDLAGHPQSTIVLPLLCPLAVMVDAAFAPESGIPDDPLAADPGLERPGSLAAAADLGAFVLDALPDVIDPSIAAEWLGAPHLDLPVPAVVRRWKAWVARAHPDPVIAAVAAALAAAGRPHGLLDAAARPLARELFHVARKAGILTWAEAHAHARAWWGSGAAEMWALAVRSLAARVEEEALAAEALPDDTPAPPATSAPPPPHEAHVSRHDREPRELAALREELDRARTELQQLRQEATKLRVEASQLRRSRAELRERLEGLEAESAPLRRSRDQLDRYARALQAQLAERNEAAAAGHPDQIPDLPEGGWPDDLLAGLHVILCTGQDRGGARKAMADALRLAGAEVTVYEANGRMPDRFPAEAVVVCDVRFIGHAAADRVRVAAARGGSEVLEVRAGEGGIVRAVARGCGRID
jgi:hypothetical protein